MSVGREDAAGGAAGTGVRRTRQIGERRRAAEVERAPAAGRRPRRATSTSVRQLPDGARCWRPPRPPAARRRCVAAAAATARALPGTTRRLRRPARAPSRGPGGTRPTRARSARETARRTRAGSLRPADERRPVCPASRTSRGSPAGICTTASRRATLARRGANQNARLRLRPDSIGNGRSTSIASGVRAGSTSSRKYARDARRAHVASSDAASTRGCPALGERGQQHRRDQRVQPSIVRRAHARRWRPAAALGVRPLASGRVSPS